MRSTLTGGFWALVLGGGTLGVASQMSEMPAGNMPPLPPQTDITAAADISPLPESPVVDAPATLPDVAATAPRVVAPVAEAMAPAPDVESAVPPATAILENVLQPPAVIADQQITLAPDAPVVPSTRVSAPTIPEQEQEVVIVTAPAEPAPVAEEPDVTVLAGLEQDLLIPAPSADVPQIVPLEELPEPELSNQPAPPEEAASAMPQSSGAVRVNRPGATPAAPVPNTAEAETDEISPLARYAAEFDNSASLPMVAIVLMDNAMIIDAPSVLRDLPFVPTIVLNASAPDVTARMQAYRAAGIEVLLQASLPVGAQPTDVETTYLAAFGLIPEAIAVFSDGNGPDAGSRAVADQITQLIAAEGRGFVTVQRGLGGALRNLSQTDVPTVNVTRELDSAGETRDAIERSLEQAAFRARQSGHAVLLGQTSPDTLAAIRSWANRTDLSQITLAPVSAILLDQGTD